MPEKFENISNFTIETLWDCKEPIHRVCLPQCFPKCEQFYFLEGQIYGDFDIFRSYNWKVVGAVQALLLTQSTIGTTDPISMSQRGSIEPSCRNLYGAGSIKI